VEAEARAVRSPNTLPSQIGAQQEASAGGGPTYTMTRFRRFRPYAKFDIEYGGADFNVGNPYFHHLSQVMYAPGGGIEYRAYRNIWVRADYEYQIWPHAFGGTFDLDPQGVTVGGMGIQGAASALRAGVLMGAALASAWLEATG